jgi:cystathionine beta-lyase/cystathionine gamma-synthase
MSSDASDGFATLGIHAGSPEPGRDDPVAPSIVRSSTFVGGPDGDASPLYGRYGNSPTHQALCGKLAALEGAEAALALSSGMAAISLTLLAFTRAGDHVVAARDLYGPTHQFMESELPRRGVEVTRVDADDGAAWEAALRPTTRLLYMEVPTNPTLRIPDLSVPARLASERGLELMVDATFATPVNLRVLEHGATLVVHSATKYMGGHSDLMAGVVAGTTSRVAAVQRMLKLYGPSLDPQAAWLLDRGLRTLALRMERHNTLALQVAHWLEGEEGVVRVLHPGLESHPDHERARRLLKGFGGVVSLVLAGGAPAADAFCGALRMARVAPSLGGVETLVSQPRFTSHRQMDRRRREEAGIPDGFVRVSVGIEDLEDIQADLARGLAAAAGRGT